MKLNEARQLRTRLQEQQWLNEFSVMVSETVQNYKLDIDRSCHSIRIDYLLLNFTQSLRRELHTEALRFLAARLKGDASNVFKSELNGLIQNTVVSLRKVLLNQHEPTFTL